MGDDGDEEDEEDDEDGTRREFERKLLSDG